MTGAERKNQWFRNRCMSGIATFIGYVLFRPRGPANQTGGFLSSIQTIHTILSRHAQFSCSFSYPSPAVPAIRYKTRRCKATRGEGTFNVANRRCVHPPRFRDKTGQTPGVTIKKKRKRLRDRVRLARRGLVKRYRIVLVTLRKFNFKFCSAWELFLANFLLAFYLLLLANFRVSKRNVDSSFMINIFFPLLN